MIAKLIEKYCKQYKEIENYDKAVNSDELWICHHREEVVDGHTIFTTAQLIELGRYYDVSPDKLIFLTVDEHRKIHNITDDYKYKRQLGMFSSKYWHGVISGKIRRTNNDKAIMCQLLDGTFKVFRTQEEVAKYFDVTKMAVSLVLSDKHPENKTLRGIELFHVDIPKPSWLESKTLKN